MNTSVANSDFILVRHAPVAPQYLGLCYGRSDVKLGRDGERISCGLAGELAALKPASIVHSGMQRTRFLAENLAERLGCTTIVAPALRERDFGDWELQSWDDIHANSGDDMLRMLSEPESFRPGGGETTFQMRDRVLGWFDSVVEKGPVVAVTHGGPIAALMGTLRNLPVSEWVKLIPGCGELVRIHTRESNNPHRRTILSFEQFPIGSTPEPAVRSALEPM